MNGGAINFFNNVENDTLDNLIFIANKANNGGAINANANIINTVLSNSKFEDNVANSGTNNLALCGDADLKLNNVTPENLGPNYVAELTILNVTASVPYGETVVVVAEVFDKKYGILNNSTILVTVNGNNYTADVDNGTARLEITDVDVGNYTVAVNLVDEIYGAVPADVTFEVNPIFTNITADAKDVHYGDIVKVNVGADVKTVNVGNAVIVVNGKSYSAKFEKGTACIEIPDLDAGNYSGVVSYDGINYIIEPVDVTFEVIPLAVNITADVNDVHYGDVVKIVVSADVKSLNAGNAVIVIDDKSYSAKFENGTACIEIPDLNARNYFGVVSYDGVNCVVEPVDVTFNVTSALVDFVFEVNDTYYGGVVKINVAVSAYGKALNDGTVLITVNNKIFLSDVVNGTAFIEIPDLDAGKYSGEVIYVDKNYLVEPANVTFNVLKLNAVIIAKNKAYVINYGGKYSITLNDAKGKAIANKKLSFTLAGKNIGSAKTNAKGVATIKLTAKILKKVKAGKKNLVIKLIDSNYNAASKTVKITINKEKTKIVAKNKIFKNSNKVKKYAVALKNSKNKVLKKVKVTLKVKGKIYKATTNAKGKAVFKITKLNTIGKFTANVKFSGNQYYKPITKKVKIIVKK